MNSEQLLELATSQKSFRYLEMLCENILNEWVYFYVIDGLCIQESYSWVLLDAERLEELVAVRGITSR